MDSNFVLRTEMQHAFLDLGGTPIPLSDYATTGLFAMAVGARGTGKTNAGLLIAESLAAQGWVSILIDPETELQQMYGTAVADAEDLRAQLMRRTRSMLVVAARDAGEFVPYGQVILEVADRMRKPMFVMIDEGQLFSASQKGAGDIVAAGNIINDFAERGRKRALDVFITAHRCTGTLHRTLFANRNLTLIGHTDDPSLWSALAPQFRASQLEFSDLNALRPGHFFCFSPRGVEKMRMPMAAALQLIAPKAPSVRPALPSTFTEWSRAISNISDEGLGALTDPVVQLLGAIAGLPAHQLLSGLRALQDESAARQCGC